jgi:hypothetical protein
MRVGLAKGSCEIWIVLPDRVVISAIQLNTS